MKPSSIGESYVFCTVCQLDFSIAGGGVHQVKRHCQSKGHTDRMKDMKRQPTLQVSLKNTATQVNCAELYFAMFIAEHNLPFAVADHFNKLCSVMFPESKIAAEFACTRTKTAALVTRALAQQRIGQVRQRP